MISCCSAAAIRLPVILSGSVSRHMTETARRFLPTHISGHIFCRKACGFIHTEICGIRQPGKILLLVFRHIRSSKTCGFIRTEICRTNPFFERLTLFVIQIGCCEPGRLVGSEIILRLIWLGSSFLRSRRPPLRSPLGRIHALSRLASKVLSRLTAEVLSRLASKVLSRLAAEVLSRLAAVVLSGLAAEALSGLAAEVLSRLAAEALSGLAAEVLSRLAAKALSGLLSICSGILHAHRFRLRIIRTGNSRKRSAARSACRLTIVRSHRSACPLTIARSCRSACPLTITRS